MLTGDVHASYVCDVKANFDDPASATVATEFVGTSITSGGNGRDQNPGDLVQLAENPHIKSINRKRGYVRNIITPSEWTADYRIVDVVTTPGAPASTRATFVKRQVALSRRCRLPGKLPALRGDRRRRAENVRGSG